MDLVNQAGGGKGNGGKGDGGKGDGGVMHGSLLCRLCDALAAKDAEDLTDVRQQILATMGPDQFVDAVGVSAMFHMMNRVANGTGTPLDPVMLKVAPAVAESIGASSFLSTAETAF